MTAAALPRARGGLPARRAVVRWSWRLFRREWRSQLLVLALLTVAVAATTLGLAAAVSASPPAVTLVGLEGSSPTLAADVAAVQRSLGPAEVVDHLRVPVPGSVDTLDVRAEQATGDNLTVHLVRGRYPTAPGEVALTRGAAALLDLRPGQTGTVGGRTAQVVGVVENPLRISDSFVLVAPGQADPPAAVTLTYLRTWRSPPHISTDHAPRLTLEGTSDAHAAAAAAVLALGTMGLLFVGLIAVAGFTVMAQRRLRALGMLGSLGATDRHVRLVMLANGAAVGAASAAAGVVGGLAVWMAVSLRLETLADHRFDRLALPWPAIAGAAALTVLTAVAAAWWPARAASRVSVVAALRGRPPRPQPAHRFGAAGAVVLAVGLLLLLGAGPHRPFQVIGGTLGTTVGTLLLAPVAIKAVSAVAGRFRVAVRLALRDLGRYQARSGAALGAVTLALGIAVAIAGSAAYDQATHHATPNLPTNQLLVSLGHGVGGPVPELTPEQLQPAQSAVAAMAADLHARAVVELDSAVNRAGPTLHDRSDVGKEPVALVTVISEPHGIGWTFGQPLYIATPALLAHYGIAAGEVDPNADVLSARHNLAGLKMTQGQPRLDPIAPKIQYTDKLPTDDSDPATLITPSAVRRLGLTPSPTGWLLETPAPLTPAQIGRARKTAAAAGIAVETTESAGSLKQLGDDATGAGIVLALGVLAMTVGLIRSETAGDLRTLAATGASSTARRSITSATAGALAVMGALLGTAGAYAALAAWHHSHLTPLRDLPVGNLGVILVGLPLAAMAGGWLLAGREPTAIARRPLD